MLAASSDVPGPADAGSLLALARTVLGLRSKPALRAWLAGGVQAFIPHAYLLVAWRDLRTGACSHETLVANADDTDAGSTREGGGYDIRAAFERWTRSDQTPVAVDARELGLAAADGAATRALMHGFTDLRGRYDCLFVFVGGDALRAPRVAEAARLLLPFFDASLRQLKPVADPLASHVPQAAQPIRVRGGAAQDDAEPDGDEHLLSARELEVMKWVRMGKTNSEIACILSLSAFTVKNHMRRIYRKLDVMNRAQAVGSMRHANSRYSNAY